MADVANAKSRKISGDTIAIASPDRLVGGTTVLLVGTAN